MKTIALVVLALVVMPAATLDALAEEESGRTVEERLDRLEREVRELRILVLELTSMLRESRAAKTAPPRPVRDSQAGLRLNPVVSFGPRNLPRALR